MTTIAWDGYILAADRKICSQGSRFRTVNKIETIPMGYAACAGNVADIHRFLRWFRKGHKGKAPKLDDFAAIVIVRGKVSMWLGDSEVKCESGQCIADGSGWKWAAAAMDFGKTAIEAVEYAITRDNYSGVGVDYVVINKQKKVKM